jgi:hypothetical protein
MKLKDPGAGEKDRKTRKEKRIDARMKAWAKPKNKKERDDAREARCKAWHGIPDEKPVETGKKVKK